MEISCVLYVEAVKCRPWMPPLMNRRRRPSDGELPQRSIGTTAAVTHATDETRMFIQINSYIFAEDIAL
ncbi:hypothetical protein JTE90_006391 [Oedothorax gibbosus]|uniref:Uncharacterized protein n=1 Tax=Oedothorax gibbosus TaxID=931172 RepID=A0AAV6VXJ5_9ARAC|nr:hypothetical protein JTE90_006391 [Oedothorax gibbosus]